MRVNLPYMITPNHHLLALSLPVALVISRQLLITQKSLVKGIAGSPNEILTGFQIRATKLTSILKNIQGYRHGGLND